MAKTDFSPPKADELKKQIEELTNNWKRALADYQNLEKNYNQEKQAVGLYLKKDILLKFLPVLETLEKAQEHLKDQGLELVLKQFKEILREEGLEEVEVLGKEFNPQTGECVDVARGDKDNMVVRVISKGYKILNTIIRPAKVIVSKKEINEKAEDLAKKAKSTGNYM